MRFALALARSRKKKRERKTPVDRLQFSASRTCLSLARFWGAQERLCTKQLKFLLSMRNMLLGYNFEPRNNSRVLGTAGSVVALGLSINVCSYSKKPM